MQIRCYDRYSCLFLSKYPTNHRNTLPNPLFFQTMPL